MRYYLRRKQHDDVPFLVSVRRSSVPSHLERYRAVQFGILFIAILVCTHTASAREGDVRLSAIGVVAVVAPTDIHALALIVPSAIDAGVVPQGSHDASANLPIMVACAAPVPAATSITVHPTCARPSALGIDVTDVAGAHVLYVAGTAVEAGVCAVSLAVADSRPGEYFAIVRDDRGRRTRLRFVVVH